MKLPIFHVDAFTSEPFRGNPAAVVILDEWLEDAVLQAVAAENNLSATAFVIPRPDTSELRWFTPEVEIQLCGHATLATAHVFFDHGYAPGRRVEFDTRGGALEVMKKEDGRLEMDFPALPAEPEPPAPALTSGLGMAPREVHRALNLLAIFDTQADVEALEPDFGRLGQLDTFGVIVSAPGQDCDFVSRFFAPGAGVPEDPVTGSAHCTLIPYWSRRLKRARLHARQISTRGGELFCEDRGERVGLAGHTREYLTGEVWLEHLV